jgi:hypothetical protein
MQKTSMKIWIQKQVLGTAIVPHVQFCLDLTGTTYNKVIYGGSVY